MRERIWEIGDRSVDLSRRGLIMGVLNVTPDSFSDGGQFLNIETAVEHGVQMASEGADIIDVGGESTRPGADPVSLEEELRRVIPVIEQLNREINAQRPTPNVQRPIVISVDTSKAKVAAAAIQAGASIVNDVTGGRGDPEMFPLVAEQRAALIIMHMQGEPRTMQAAPHYVDLIGEVSDFFRKQYARALECGVDPMTIAFDPGIGFGKTLDHNLELLGNLERLRAYDRPLVVGVSRKSFLGKLVGTTEMDDRLALTVAMTALLRTRGADVLRVHDVLQNVNAMRAAEAIVEKQG